MNNFLDKQTLPLTSNVAVKIMDEQSNHMPALQLVLRFSPEHTIKYFKPPCLSGATDVSHLSCYDQKLLYRLRITTQKTERISLRPTRSTPRIALG